MDRIVLALVGLVTILRMVYLLTAPMLDVTYRVSDDAYYYFNVARHIIAGQGATFDGINRTNGFHPLWMLCLLPVYAMFQENAETALRSVLCIVTVVAGGAAWAAYRFATKTAGGRAALVVLAAIPIPIFLNPLVNGLETGLLILLLFLLLHGILKYNLLAIDATWRQNALLGLLLGFVFLARLDSVFIILGILGAIIIRSLRLDAVDRPFSGLFAKLWQIGLTSTFLVVPYFVWNLTAFGHFAPISGSLKSTFPLVSFRAERLSSLHTLTGLVQLAVCTILVAKVGLGRSATLGQEGRLRELLLALWVGCGLHFLNTVLFLAWGVHWWHYSSYVPLTLALVGLAVAWIERLLPDRGLAPALVIVVVLVAAGANYLDVTIRREHHRPWYEAAVWAREKLPQDAVIAMTDCGLIGYFAGRPTVNLDGVINGYEYQMALRDGRLTEYLKRSRVSHVADYEVVYGNGAYKIRLPARLYRAPGGQIIARQEAEIYASQPYYDSRHWDRPIHFAIWRLEDLKVVD